MKPIYRHLIASGVGLALGFFINLFLREEQRPLLQTASESRPAFVATPQPEKRANPDSIPSSDPEQAWAEYLDTVLPPNSTSDSTLILSRLADLAKEAVRGNPFQADLERSMLLARVSMDQAPLLMGEMARWPNAGSAFAPWNDLFRRWASQNPRQALGLLPHLPPVEARAAFRTVISKWTEADPEAALAHVTSSKDQAVRTDGLKTAVSSLANRDPKLALNYAVELGGEAAPVLVDEIVGVWASQDGAGAVAWIAANPALAKQDRLLGQALSTWAAKEPSLAANYAMAHLMEREGAHWLPRIFQNWAIQDPNAAFDALHGLPLNRVGQEVIESTARMMAMNDSRFSGQANEGILQKADRLPKGAARDAFLAGLVKFGADNDVHFALRVVPLLDESKTREEALNHLAGVWGKKDVFKAAEWLNSLPPSPSKDSAVGHFAAAAVERDALGAIQWVSSIQDPETRSFYRALVFKNWRERNPEAAKEWLRQEEAVSSEEKRKLNAEF